MVLDFILLNLVALCGTFGMAVILALAIHPAAGGVLMLAGFAFANWAWWDVHFRMDKRIRERYKRP